jgi:GTP-binding protein HflX
MAEEGTLAPDWSARTIEVLNKADLLGGVGGVPARPGGVAVSALTGEGLPSLREVIYARISEGLQTVGYDVPTSDGAQLAWLYEHGEVVGRQDGDEAIHVTVRLSPGDRARFERRATRQGSRMSLAGDDPEHVVVVPGGLLAPAAKAGLAAAIAGDEVEGDSA